MRKIITASLFCIVGAIAHAQFLKKLKDKVNTTVESAATNGSQQKGAKEPSIKWCDTVTLTAKNYTQIFTDEGSLDILYDESTIDMCRNSNENRLILKQRANKKTQYLVIDNGKVIATVNNVEEIDEYILQCMKGSNSDASKKYIVPEKIIMDLGMENNKQQSTTIKKIDDNQVNSALAIMKQTEEYKKMSAEEKQQIEAIMNQGVAMNNANAGKTFSGGGPIANPEIDASKVVINGKTYGIFLGNPEVQVSADKSHIYIYGVMMDKDKKQKMVFVANDKTYPVLNNGGGVGGVARLLMSDDGKKGAVVEQNYSQSQMAAMAKPTNGAAQSDFTVLKSDGTKSTFTSGLGLEILKLLNNGVVAAATDNAIVYGDGKFLGKFNLDAEDFSNDNKFDISKVLFGSDETKMACYSNGNLYFLNSPKANLGIIAPKVINVNGKTYISWFRKCGNKIYVARYDF